MTTFFTPQTDTLRQEGFIMQQKRLFSSSLTMAMLFACSLFASHPRRAEAGCGCDKPAPAPAAIIPSAAFSGMKVTLFDTQLRNGQSWTVTFQNGPTSVKTTATVVTKPSLTDPPGATVIPQLVVTVPAGVAMGPTRILASSKKSSLTVSEQSFTIIGKPLVLSEQMSSSKVESYTTGVGADGTLYVSLGGLQEVCQPFEVKTQFTNYPLRFALGDVVVLNHQGFLIDTLNDMSADHFVILPSGGAQSNVLDYYRHSFEMYCERHLTGGAKAVDTLNPDWHLDGTAHTDYSTLIFAIAGRFADGSQPQPGSVTFGLTLTSRVGDPVAEPWAQEKEEENILGGSSSTTGQGTNSLQGRDAFNTQKAL